MRAPLNGQLVVTNPFGEPGYGVFGKHAGVDLRAAVGTSLFAPDNGVINDRYVGSAGIQVLQMRIGNHDHRFLHLSEMLVSVGQNVQKGQLIGKTGNSGNVLAHLHWDARKAGTAWNASFDNYTNPMNLINEGSTGGLIMDTEAKVGAQYYTLRGNEGTSAERKSWVGKSYEQFNAVARPEVDSREAHKRNLESAVANLTRERDEARAQVASLTAQLANSQDQIAVLTTQLTESQAQYQGSVEAYKQLEAQHKAQIEELNKVIEIKDNEIKRLTAELANCGGESLTWSQHLVLGIKGLLNALNPISK